MHSDIFADGLFPRVTVVVPAYNHARYIGECLASILDQDYPEIDLIVINDGSTDGTDEAVKEVLGGHPGRYRYIVKENEGLVKTLNLGLRLAGGEYFCEIASDDRLTPGSVRKRAAYLKQHGDIDAVFADAFLLEGTIPTDVLLGRGMVKYDSSCHSVSDLLAGSARILFPSGMIRKRTLERIGGFDEDLRYYEDLSVIYRLASSSRIGCLREPVMFYRRHGANLSSSDEYLVRREKILAVERLAKEGINVHGGFVKKILYREYVKCLKLSLRRPVPRDEIRTVYRKAKSLHPWGVKNRLYFVLGMLRREKGRHGHLQAT